MNLFNRKTLKRVIKPAPIPASHLLVLEGWAELIRTGRVYTHKETALREDFTSEIV